MGDGIALLCFATVCGIQRVGWQGDVFHPLSLRLLFLNRSANPTAIGVIDSALPHIFHAGAGKPMGLAHGASREARVDAVLLRFLTIACGQT